MKKQISRLAGMLSILLLILFTFGCSDPAVSPESGENQQMQKQQSASHHSPAMGQAHGQSNFRTHLTGAEEVPAVDTRAHGQAIFRLTKDGSAIHYKLIVANIENVLMAHIHNAPAGVNGGIVVWLYPAAPPPQLIEGRFDGVLAEGTITASDFVGSLAGQSLEDLLELMRSGETYVNVHTTQNPGGEVRGQIR